MNKKLINNASEATLGSSVREAEQLTRRAILTCLLSYRDRRSFQVYLLDSEIGNNYVFVD